MRWLALEKLLDILRSQFPHLSDGSNLRFFCLRLPETSRPNIERSLAFCQAPDLVLGAAPRSQDPTFSPLPRPLRLWGWLQEDTGLWLKEY